MDIAMTTMNHSEKNLTQTQTQKGLFELYTLQIILH